MIVMKFGGTSVGNADRIKAVAGIIKSYLDKKPAVVVSAVGGVTNMLIEAAEKAFKGENPDPLLKKIEEKHYDIIKNLGLNNSLIEGKLREFHDLIYRVHAAKEITTETMDNIQSFGERISSRILAAYLNKIGVDAEAHNAYDVGLITNDDFGKAEPLPESEKELRKNLSNKKSVPVITGFIGKNTAGAITTLGRGGSDYSASIIGAAINAKEIQIWTDVNGVMSADPKVVKDAKTIGQISFNEASELAYFGAKVLHPKTLLPAMKKNIPVRVLNSFVPENKGTTIVNKAGRTTEVVKAIASKKNIFVISIASTRMLLAHGFLAKVFAIFDHYQLPVDMVSTSEVSVSLSVDKITRINDILKELRKIADVSLEENKAIVCVVGEGMKHTPGVAGKIFSILGKNKVNVEMISQGASEINISFIVSNKDADKAVQVLHKEYFG